MVINYKHLSPQEAKEYKSLWETVDYTFKNLHFTEEMNAAIVSIAVDICGTCRENTSECQCWNDE